MALINKNYLKLLMFSIFTIIFMFVFMVLSNKGFYQFDLDKKEFNDISTLAQNGDEAAMRRLMNYYYINEKDKKKTIDFIKKYKDISTKYKRGLYAFSIMCNLPEIVISLATELANEENYSTQYDLADFYKYGIFVEKDLKKAEYWSKISECNKKGINIKECETDKEVK
ncbi:MAG: SEL1-like repeat protein [Campylobacteraceae bacterium]|jgi:TPR repeat protein|nr:SEL1-like repeat protein [Campylobacteraceae bacterium]